VAKTPIPDDITLEDDPDVIELEDEILDRYLAITAAKATTQKRGNGSGNHRVATPKPPPPRPLPLRKSLTGPGKKVRFTLTPTLQTQSILPARVVQTGRTGSQ
jgi:hypothetical protein